MKDARVLADQLREVIRTIPDFPKPGILFRDITTLLLEPATFKEVVDTLCYRASKLKAEGIVAIESRGFVFGAPMAVNLGIPLILARKPGKLPGKTRGVEYALEYGTDRIEVHEDAITQGQRVVIVDDLLATGGTAGATAKLVEELGGIVAGILFVVELPDLKGRERLSSYAVESLVTFEGD